MSFEERRKSGDRRRQKLGPPEGIAERRINVERRMFDMFSPDSGEEAGAGLHAVVREGIRLPEAGVLAEPALA